MVGLLLRRLRRERAERGGVAAVFAAVLGASALLSVGALVVDVGQLYAEREQLQNGADAAAIALARTCAAVPAQCGDQAATAARYADGNANDGISRVIVVCGTAPQLPACPPQGSGLSACLGTPPAIVPYVEVRTATARPDGGTLLPPTFASTIAGYADYAGRTLTACARAAYGTPGRMAGTAVTVSQCVWTALTDSGANLAPAPDVASPPPGVEGVIYLHDPKGDDPLDCPTSVGGKTAPGGFGWLSDTDGGCMATGTVGGYLAGDSGNDTSSACASSLQAIAAAHGTALLPVFDAVTGTGANVGYHVAGFSVFALTGYHLSGLSQPSWLSHQDPCGGSQRCLYGYFTSTVMVSGVPFAGTNYGVSAISLVG